MYDVIVLGSGGAGLTAALSAAVNGTRVLVLEASSRWGGSTGVSAGEVWVPGNHLMADLGVPDSVEDALEYCRPYGSGKDCTLIEKFVRSSPEMANFVEESSPIIWKAMSSPDSFAERPGGRDSGRHIEVSPLAVGKLASLEEDFWLSNYPAIFTNDEVFNQRLLIGGEIPEKLAEERIRFGMVCTGIGLIVGLMQGCLAQGVKFERNVRAVRLLNSQDKGINGVVVERGDLEEEIYCNRGVVLATGGFEWNEKMRANLSGGHMTHAVSPPLHLGDGLRMVADVGGQLANTDDSWMWPVIGSSGEVWPSTKRARNDLMLAERFMPHAIWVNRTGNRFVNESSHNCALALAETDADTDAISNLPAWAIFDHQYRSRYPLAGSMPHEELPAQVVEAASLSELAFKTGIDESGLLRTVDRFNDFVDQGRDSDYFRGQSAYDRHYGDPTSELPNLGRIERSPFFSLPVYLGTVGTKGGARIDERARVLDSEDQAIPGLWAAGNAMASIIGSSTIAPGLTIGLALTWGFIAGEDASSN